MNKLEIVYQKTSDLKPYENNPRHNEDAVEYVAKSIKEFGFKVPIIVDKNNVIVAGHTRLLAAIDLGIDEVPTILADDLDEKQIKAFRLADNKVSDYSFWDNKLLLEELEGLGDIFTGFEVGEIFGEELDEKNDFIDDVLDTIGDEYYVVSYKCYNKEQYDKIMNYINELEKEYEEK